MKLKFQNSNPLETTFSWKRKQNQRNGRRNWKGYSIKRVNCWATEIRLTNQNLPEQTLNEKEGDHTDKEDKL